VGGLIAALLLLRFLRSRRAPQEAVEESAKPAELAPAAPQVVLPKPDAEARIEK